VASGARCVLRDVFARILAIRYIVSAHNHEYFTGTWRDIDSDYGDVLTGRESKRGRDGRAVHRIDDQSLSTLLDQRVNIRDLLSSVIIGNKRPDQSSIVLGREFRLVRNIIGPKIGVVEGERYTEFKTRV
jgi:hypothetical protein